MTHKRHIVTNTETSKHPPDADVPMITSRAPTGPLKALNDSLKIPGDPPEPPIVTKKTPYE